MKNREAQLVDVARWARRYLRKRLTGIGPAMSANEEVFLNRRLTEVLGLYRDIEPIHDADKAEWRKELMDRR